MTAAELALIITALGTFFSGAGVAVIRAVRGCHDKYETITADLDDMRKSLGLVPYKLVKRGAKGVDTSAHNP